MHLAQGFAMADAIRPVVAVLGVQDAAVVLVLAQAVLMQELKDAVAVLDLALGSALDAVLVQHLAEEDATPAVEEHVEHLLVRVHANTSVVVHAMDAVHAEELATVAIAVQAVVLLLAVEVARAAHLAVDALAATVVKAVVVAVSLLVVAHAELLPSNFYI